MFSLLPHPHSSPDSFRFRPAVPSPLSFSSLPSPPPSSPTSDRTGCITGPCFSSPPPRRLAWLSSSPVTLPPPHHGSVSVPRPRRFDRRPTTHTPDPSRPGPQELRRRQFLQCVSGRSRDKAWQRRDIEGHLLQQEWLDEAAWIRDRRREQAAVQGLITDADIEDAASFQSPQTAWAPSAEPDSAILMADEMARCEQMELDTRLALLDDAGTSFRLRQSVVPDEPTAQDDEEFDQMLIEFAQDYEGCEAEHMDSS